MANNATKTEHNGAKNGRGAYYGHRFDAKNESDKKRREYDRLEVESGIEEVTEPKAPPRQP